MLLDILKKRLRSEIKGVEQDSRIKDRFFAERATDLLDETMQKNT